MLLKADLHLHTSEAEPTIRYDARSLIARAARQGFRVLSITNHDVVTFSDELAAYARDRGVLLIPGVEATIEGKHVLLYNIDVPLDRIQTFAELRRLRTSDWLVVAPHPFFPQPFCLGRRLVREIDLFDAIELSHFYTRRIDFNQRAIRLAQEVGLPLVGTSDSHLTRQVATTYSIVESEPTTPAVLAAVRKGLLTVVSRPLVFREWAGIGLEMLLGIRTAGKHPGLPRLRRRRRLPGGVLSSAATASLSATSASTDFTTGSILLSAMSHLRW